MTGVSFFSFDGEYSVYFSDDGEKEQSTEDWNVQLGMLLLVLEREVMS